MKRQRLLWQIYIPVVLIIFTSIIASTWYAANSLRDYSIEQAKNDLLTRSKLIKKQLAEPFYNGDYHLLGAVSRQIGQESSTRITMINQEGMVLTDSMEDAVSMENHASRLEVRKALDGEIAYSIRHSKTLNKKLLYLAVPLSDQNEKQTKNDSVQGVLRLSIPIISIDHALGEVLTRIIFGTVVLVIIAAVLVLTVSRKITKPLEEMRTYAELLAGEEFNEDFTIIAGKDTSEEIAGLAESMNKMALHLRERVDVLTRQRNMRRDFVANVSHELRTPITAIKGFVETLQDGAISCPEDAKRFLEIILKHADRLNAIVSDLLTLSRIEQEDEQKEIVLRDGLVNKILNNAAETCSAKAQEKNISLSINCANELSLAMDEDLLEQAVVNLVVNAIKYSHENSTVKIKAEKDEQYIVITVADSGVGIDQEHLPRLFERFYRSDKARSRKLGGTGLGLSIVKHIAQAHGGMVDVSSSPGNGSVFFIKIPA